MSVYKKNRVYSTTGRRIVPNYISLHNLRIVFLKDNNHIVHGMTISDFDAMIRAKRQ